MSDGDGAPGLLVVAPSAYPLGGVATWLGGLVPGLRARGWRVDLALLVGAHHDVDRYLGRHPALAGARRVGNPGGSREGRLRALARTVRDVSPDVVLSVNVGDIEDAVDRLREEGGPGARLVTTQHGLQRDFYDHLRSRRAIVDGVAVTNRLSERLAVEYAGMEPERVAYAPYGVELPADGTERDDGADGLRIAWVGRLESDQKRAGDLPGICAALERRGLDWLLRIAGTGPEGARVAAALRRFVESGCVELLGDLAAENLAERVWSASDVLLVTSSWETGPIVAWEATSAGLAVASSRFLGSGLEGALREDETAKLFEVGDVEGAAEALAALGSAGARERLHAALRREVETRYTTEASLDAWDAALRRFAGRAPRPASGERRSAAPSGRLDRWLGARLAETWRRRLGIRHRQPDAGAEWPHVGPGAATATPRPFEALARELDATAAGAAP